MQFEINNKKYKLAVTWDDITLKHAIEIGRLKMDGELESCIELLAILSSCPINILRQTQDIYIRVLYDAIKDNIDALSNFNLENYKPTGITEIKFKGTRYYMPETLDLKDNPILAYSEDSKNVCEAADLMAVLSKMKAEGFESMKYVCAIYLKEKGEKHYNEEKIAKRAAKFEELPMWVVWDVFFFIYLSLCSYAINSVSYSKPKLRLKIMGVPLLLIGFIVWQMKRLQGLFSKSKK